MNNGVVLFAFNPTTGFWLLKEINQGVLSISNISSGYLPPNISFYDFVDPQFWVPLTPTIYSTTSNNQTFVTINVQENVIGIVLGVIFGSLFVVVLGAIIVFVILRKMKPEEESVDLEPHHDLLIHYEDIQKEGKFKDLTPTIHVWKGIWRHQEW
jgi:hypothetical protein